MSGEETEAGVATRVRRTVTPEYFGRRDVEMDVLGWTLFLGLIVLLVPLLPFIVILWVGDKVLAFLRRAEGEES